MNNSLGPALFTNQDIQELITNYGNDYTTTDILSNSVIVGIVQFKQNRVKNRTCDRYQSIISSNIECYEIYYNSNTKQTSAITTT